MKCQHLAAPESEFAPSSPKRGALLTMTNAVDWATPELGLVETLRETTIASYFTPTPSEVLKKQPLVFHSTPFRQVYIAGSVVKGINLLFTGQLLYFFFPLKSCH